MIDFHSKDGKIYFVVWSFLVTKYVDMEMIFT